MKDISGFRFGKLTAIRREESACKEAMWLCVCDCGSRCVVRRSNLISGNTQSCGCSRSKMLSARKSDLISLYGVQHSIREWSAITGIPKTPIHNRIHNLKWSVRRSLTEPSRSISTARKKVL